MQPQLETFEIVPKNQTLVFAIEVQLHYREVTATSAELFQNCCRLAFKCQEEFFLRSSAKWSNIGREFGEEF